MDRGGLTVLVVDDYADTREFIRTLLEMKGCRVFEAANGREAVNIAANTVLSFILMDLEMPVLNGFEATREILAHQKTVDVPIIAFSANCSQERQQRALDVGCRECIPKPVDFSRIDDLINQYSSNAMD
ncbi:MAG TPA: response regulator [Pyrinomonadaceae bacterium]|jgi:CheY-like chemotaxis protein